MNGLPPTVGNAGDPKSYVSSIYVGNTPGGAYAFVQTNSLCTTRGDFVNGNTYGYGCMNQTSNASQGASQASASSVTISLTPPPSPAAAPTLSEWAMILLGVLLAGGAALNIHRRRQTV